VRARGGRGAAVRPAAGRVVPANRAGAADRTGAPEPAAPGGRRRRAPLRTAGDAAVPPPAVPRGIRPGRGAASAS